MDGIFFIPFPTGKNSGKDIRALERTTGWRRVTSVAPDTSRKPQAVAPGLGGKNKCEQSEYDRQQFQPLIFTSVIWVFLIRLYRTENIR